MGSIWFKHRQNQTVPKKSFTSPNLVKYIFTFNNSKDKESSSSSNNARNIPASASDSRIKNIMSNNNNNNSRGVINTKINEDANKESKSSSSSSSEEDKKEENELPKPNFEFPLLNHIYPNRNRRATLAQIDVQVQNKASNTNNNNNTGRRKTLTNIDGDLLSKKRVSLASSNEDFSHYERRRRTTLSNINEGVYKTYKEGMIAFVPKTYSIHDDYEFSETVLGKGFNGKVTVITNKKTGVKCALKCLKDSIRAKREVDLQWRACQGSFLFFALLLKTFNILLACQGSPYIVHIIDVYENLLNDSKRVLYVVMELMEGGQLFERIKDKTRYFSERALIMKQICMAVNHLHIMGIAHRDLKPENLLFTSKNKDALIKLIDFGFAKEEILNLSTPCFTPYYVAPEIVKSEKYDSKCDIWALGIIMYMLCFKRPPFFAHGDEPLSPGMKKRIINGQYSFPKQKKGGVEISPDAKNMIKRMLDVNSNTRISIDEILTSDWLIDHTEQPSTPKNISSPKQNALEIVSEMSESNYEKSITSALKVIRSINEPNDSSIHLDALSNAKNSLLQRRLNKKSKSIEHQVDLEPE